MANWLGDLLDSDQGKEPTAPPTEHDEDPLRNWLNVGPREPLHITQWRRLWLFEGIMTLAGDILFEHGSRQGGSLRLEAEDIETRNEAQVLATDDSNEIIRRGRVILVRYLQARRVLDVPSGDATDQAAEVGMKIAVNWTVADEGRATTG